MVSSTVVPCSSVDRHEELADGLLADEVEADGGLVEQQDGRIVEQRRRELAAHPLPERELAHRHVEQRPEVEPLREAAQVGRVALGRHPVDVAEQVEAVAQGEVPPQLRSLTEHHADAPGQLGALPARLEAVHAHRARRWARGCR